ncbi:hypothetical protein [Sphingobium yanoikuyae]|uniref:hypothetical protein n=1 Tax=Sphingobium yanoikuyae TaxID=13690 RepID=UPI0013E06E3E|nr:hypothetical protein [Sphingobium yanoikuyae]
MSKDGNPKFVPACNLRLTEKNVFDMMVTDLTVCHRRDHHRPFNLARQMQVSRYRLARRVLTPNPPACNTTSRPRHLRHAKRAA